MSYSKRFIEGIGIASQSFSMAWHNKQLLSYTIIPMALMVLAQFIVYNFFAHSLIQKLEAFFSIDTLVQQLLTSPNAYYYALAFGINFINIMLITFFYAGLTHHTMRLLQHHTDISFRTTLHSCFNHLRLILEWSAISAIVTLILQLPAAFGSTLTIILMGTSQAKISILLPLAIIVFCISMLWSLMTLLVVPVITFGRITIRQAISISISTIRRALIEVLGGIVWICLLGTLAGGLLTLPGIILSIFFHSQTANQLEIPVSIMLLLIIPISLLGVYLSAVYGIFRTKILYQFYERQVDELQQVEHPPY